MSALSRLNQYIQRQNVLSGRPRAAPCTLGVFDILSPPPDQLATEPTPPEPSSATTSQPDNPRPEDAPEPAATETMGDTSTPFRLMDLPPEIRDQIWVMALPNHRVFHVHKTQRDESCANGSHHLIFHYRHPPPAVPQVCVEAREAARRSGCFYFSQPPGREAVPGVYFNPEKDVLYFDRDNRSAFGRAAESSQPASKFRRVPGLRRAKHMGVEWRWFLRNGTLPLEEYSSDAMRGHWTATMEAIRAHVPLVTTLHYILPVIRHQGGFPWGREPRPFKTLPIDVVPLPGGTVIPIESGHRTWDQVRAEVVKTFDALGLEEGVPEIVGWWLLRRGAPTDFGHSTVRVFDY